MNLDLHLSALWPVLAPALAAGNCVVLKPSEFAPATGAAMKRIISEAFPPEQVMLVEGEGAVVVPQLMRGYRFAHVFYTGSTFVGKAISAATGHKRGWKLAAIAGAGLVMGAFIPLLGALLAMMGIVKNPVGFTFTPLLAQNIANPFVWLYAALAVPGDDVRTALERADRAMYERKRGRKSSR